MDLQTTFYIIGIIFMGLMLVILLALVAAVFVIRAKVNAIHKAVEEKLSLVTSLSGAGANIFKTVKNAVDKSK